METKNDLTDSEIDSIHFLTTQLKEAEKFRKAFSEFRKEVALSKQHYVSVYIPGDNDACLRIDVSMLPGIATHLHEYCIEKRRFAREAINRIISERFNLNP